MVVAAAVLHRYFIENSNLKKHREIERLARRTRDELIKNVGRT